ncbi:MAG TPA: hypothetical protein VGD00_00205 [Solirubrobacteraceae bacterium]|jgi:hypothetical protein
MDDVLLPVQLWSQAPKALFRWVAPHPQWRPTPHDEGPDDWEQLVGSLLYELPEVAVLIDPLLPAVGRERFLAWLDERIGARRVSILTTIRWHRRDRDELAGRYRRAGGPAWNAVPHGVVPKPLRGAGETLYWLADAKSLVAGDRLLGDGRGGLRLCPDSWLREASVDRRGLARLMRPLLELPIERVLVSHGEPVLHDGRAALAHAIREAEGG